MDLWKSVQVVLRRWYVMVPLAALAIVVALTSSGQVRAEYKGDTALFLVAPPPPASDAVDDRANPLGGGLPVVAQVLQIATSSGETVRRMADAGLSTEFSVSVERRAPVIYIEATSESPTEAVRTVDELTQVVTEQLREREDSFEVSPEQRINIDVIRRSDVATVDLSGQKRVKILIGAVGLGLSLVAAFAVDGLILGRRPDVPPDAPPSARMVPTPPIDRRPVDNCRPEPSCHGS